MKVNEASKELQNLIFKYFQIDTNNSEDNENKERTLNDLLYNVRYELMQNYHYDSVEDKKLSMSIIKKIDALGT